MTKGTKDRGLQLAVVLGDKGASFDKSGKASLFKSELTSPGEERAKTYE